MTSLGDNPPAKIGFALGTLASGGTVCTVVLANDNGGRHKRGHGHGVDAGGQPVRQESTTWVR